MVATERDFLLRRDSVHQKLTFDKHLYQITDNSSNMENEPLSKILPPVESSKPTETINPPPDGYFKRNRQLFMQSLQFTGSAILSFFFLTIIMGFLFWHSWFSYMAVGAGSSILLYSLSLGLKYAPALLSFLILSAIGIFFGCVLYFRRKKPIWLFLLSGGGVILSTIFFIYLGFHEGGAGGFFMIFYSFGIGLILILPILAIVGILNAVMKSKGTKFLVFIPAGLLLILLVFITIFILNPPKTAEQILDVDAKVDALLAQESVNTEELVELCYQYGKNEKADTCLEKAQVLANDTDFCNNVKFSSVQSMENCKFNEAIIKGDTAACLKQGGSGKDICLQRIAIQQQSLDPCTLLGKDGFESCANLQVFEKMHERIPCEAYQEYFKYDDINGCHLSNAKINLSMDDCYKMNRKDGSNEDIVNCMNTVADLSNDSTICPNLTENKLPLYSRDECLMRADPRYDLEFHPTECINLTISCDSLCTERNLSCWTGCSLPRMGQSIARLSYMDSLCTNNSIVGSPQLFKGATVIRDSCNSTRVAHSICCCGK